VLCFKWDRFIREPLDLEYLIPRFDKAGVRFAEVDGSIDLGTDSGPLHARIMIAVAKAEQERKAERQKLAFEQAAINGKRFTGCPRPFGYLDDHVTAHPVEGPAVAEACAALLGGGTISAVMREWTKLGLKPPQQARRGTTKWNPDQYPDDPAEPSDRGAVCLPRARAVGAAGAGGDLAGGAGHLGRPDSEAAARGADAAGRAGVVPVRERGHRHAVPRRASHLPVHPATRNRAYTGGHVARQAEPVETFVEKLVVARLSRADAADLVSIEEAGVDVAGLREEAAAIRRNLEEMAGDCALGRISRAQMLKATQAGNVRLETIGADLESAAQENVLAPLVAAENAAAVWADLDIGRKRAVIKTLMSVTLHSPGKGARRAFDPATVQVAWNQPDPA
jgi:site-specific DNA recombinase